MGAPLLVIRTLLAAVFLVAAGGKLRDRDGSRQAVEQFGVPRPAVRPIATMLPLAEVSVAAGLLIDPVARYAAIAALLMLIAFIAAIGWAISRGRAPDCHCFGQIHSEPAGPSTVLRNVILAGLALAVAIAGGGPRIPAGADHLTGTEVELVVVSGIAIVLALATATLWGDLSRARHPAAIVSARPSPGLLRGMEAPDFDLTPLRGTACTLSELTAGSRPVVLVFVSGGCGSCAALFPDLGRWQESFADRVVLAPIFTGDRTSAQRIIDDHEFAIALGDDGTAAFERYLLTTMPSAVLIDPDGTIAGAAAVGPQAVEELIRAAVERAPVPQAIP